MIKIKNYIISLIISIGIGQISGFLTKNASKNFSSNFNQPALTPPDWVFPVVWVILFFLMGISATLVYESDCKYKKYGLLIYGVQLVFNFLWSMFFFLGEQFVLSFGGWQFLSLWWWEWFCFFINVIKLQVISKSLIWCGYFSPYI